MKIVCHREALFQGVSAAASVAPPRNTKAILSGVKLSAFRDRTEALATDLEIAIRSRLQEIIVEEEGEVVLTAKLLVEILRSIESDEVTIESSGRQCEVRAADARYELVTDDPDEFPEIKTGGAGGVSVPRAFLEEMFQRTSFAAARDVGRYAINGILVELTEGQIRLVATDGRRLAVATRALPDDARDPRRVIVPTKGLQECLRGSEGCESVRLQLEERRVVLSSDRVEVSTKPVEGEFPEYAAVIPAEHQGQLTVDRDALLSAVRKVSVMSGDEMRAIQVDVSEGMLAISARVEGRGRAQTELPVETEGQSQFKVDFNPEFVADYLKVLPSGPVIFRYKEAGGAGVFQLRNSEDIYVVMPITTS